MSDLDQTILPGSPGSKLAGAWQALTGEYKEAFAAHLFGDTSAEWLADWLTRFGHPVSASTIRTYRRSLRQSGV